jgi:hypothetical protein
MPQTVTVAELLKELKLEIVKINHNIFAKINTVQVFVPRIE